MVVSASGIHDDFTFGANGYFFDDLGQPCVLLGVVEFTTFWHHLDSLFSSPLGRKLIYAATDAEERILRQSNLQFGRWFGKRNVAKKLGLRASSMGWGDFGKDHIVNPAHDGLAVGFALAHHEHLTRQRANVDWKQMSPELIRLVFEPKNDMMDSPLAPDTTRWFGVGPSSVVSESLELDLDIRHSMFFNGDERSFFIPIHMFYHLLQSLLGRPIADDNSSKFPITTSEEMIHVDALRCVVQSACAAFEASERAVYLQSRADWDGHLRERFIERGLGNITVEESLLDGAKASIFTVRSPIAPFACGLLVGMWQRAHGDRPVVHIEEGDGFLRIHVAPQNVNYATESQE